jgi:hypothetical protein
MNVALQPVGNEIAKYHYSLTIQKPVSLSSIQRYFTPTEYNELSKIFPENNCLIWGIKDGKKNRNLSKYKKMKREDIVFFFKNQKIFSYGKIKYLIINRSLATSLWNVDVDGKTWPNIYFLKEVNKVNISQLDFNSQIGWKSNAHVQAFNVLKPIESAKALKLIL